VWLHQPTKWMKIGPQHSTTWMEIGPHHFFSLPLSKSKSHFPCLTPQVTHIVHSFSCSKYAPNCEDTFDNNQDHNRTSYPCNLRRKIRTTSEVKTQDLEAFLLWATGCKKQLLWLTQFMSLLNWMQSLGGCHSSNYRNLSILLSVTEEIKTFSKLNGDSKNNSRKAAFFLNTAWKYFFPL
jgi:hypothetical protein